jgi:ubiquitin-like protein Pup
MQKQKQIQSQTRKPAEQETESPAANVRNDQLTDDVDVILDEIDTVLEPNAEAFVKGFLQKGGQ